MQDVEPLESWGMKMAVSVSMVLMVRLFAFEETRVLYGTVRTVVWEDGGSNPASYPIDIFDLAMALCQE
jgi:hypothetical protein